MSFNYGVMVGGEDLYGPFTLQEACDFVDELKDEVKTDIFGGTVTPKIEMVFLKKLGMIQDSSGKTIVKNNGIEIK